MKTHAISLQNKVHASGLQSGCDPRWECQNRSQGSFNDASHLTVPQDQRAAGAENFGTLALFQHAHTCAGGLLCGARRAARPPLERKGVQNLEKCSANVEKSPTNGKVRFCASNRDFHFSPGLCFSSQTPWSRAFDLVPRVRPRGLCGGNRLMPTRVRHWAGGDFFIPTYY